MKKFFKLFLVTFFCISISIFLSCNKNNERVLPEDNPTALVIMAGNHSNSKKIEISLEEKLRDVYSRFGNASFIVIDGEPTVEFKDEKMVGFYDNNYIKKSKEIYKYKEIWERDYLNKQVSKLKNAIDETQAGEPEVDTLKALQVASNTLNVMQVSMESNVKKEIIIYDTGLSTTGKFNFLNKDCLKLLSSKSLISQDDKMKKKLKKILDNLEDNKEIPNLKDVTVTWYGLGKVGDPQPELTNLNIQNLQYIWEELLLRTNALPSEQSGTEQNYGFFADTVTNGIIRSDKSVSNVIFWNDIINNNMNSDNEGNYKEVVEPPTFTEEELGFIPNKAVYISETQANKVIMPYVQNLQYYPDMRILLVGTTADPNQNGGSITLSKERAEKVKESFVKLGILESRIETIGVGAKSARYKSEWENGVFDNEIAKNNRLVIILPYNSKEAQEILNTNWDKK